MATKTVTPVREPVGRVGQRRQVVIPREIFDKLRMREGDFVAFAEQGNGILVKPKRLVDAEDTLTAAETALVKKAEREMSQGKYVTLDQVRHELDRKASRKRRKTA